jgi:hypothetical protein
MRTDELIVDLARRGDAVTPLRPPVVRFAWWAIAATGILAIAVAWRGPREDLAAVLSQPRYAATGLATLATAWIAAAAAFVMSVPGAARSRMVRVGPLVAAACWMGLAGAGLMTGASTWRALAHEPIVLACVLKTLVFASVPGVVLVALLRRAAPLEGAWTLALAALGALALGAVGTQIYCPIDESAHMIAGHVVPVLVLASATAVFGRRVLGLRAR